jgi:hypothetical protein
MEMTLQRNPEMNGNPEASHPSVHVISKVVRPDPSAIGVYFVFTQPHERRRVREFLKAMQPGRD